MVDTDRDGKFSQEELKVFYGKCIDLAVAIVSRLIDVVDDISSAIGEAAIIFLVQKLFNGEEITMEAFGAKVSEVGEDGPEALLGPLME